MAKVFLSYVREDVAKARSIAASLEEAGHEVWWDRHITGGTQYSKEIEAALANADKVVVLWSVASSESTWVRDEATVGRDTGRLVPVHLDGTEPPMGFRQYQAIDFSRRGAHRREQSISELLHAIDAKGPGKRAAPGRRLWQGTPRPWIGLATVAAIGALVLLSWQLWSPRPSVPSVTVIANDDSAHAKALANDLLVKLGSLQASRADSLELVESASGADAQFAFKVSGVAVSGDPRANLALVNRDGTLLWSREFVQPGGSEADLRQQIAYSAGQVLQCATEALAPEGPKLALPVLKKYLTGCAELSADPLMTIPLFREVTVKAPQFTHAWGNLLIAELEAFKSSRLSDESLQNALRQHSAEARKLNPELAEIYLVQSWLQPPRPILGWMRFADKALEKNPENARILDNHAIGLGHFGRMRDAIGNARRATELEPLSPGLRQTLIDFLMNSGELEAARREMANAERLWPGASNLPEARFLLEYRYGDPKEALNLLESGRLKFTPTPAQRSFLRARIDPSATNVDRAISDARQAYQQDGELNQFIQVLATFSRKDEIIDALLTADPQASPGVISVFFRAPMSKVRQDPRFMAVAHRYGLVDYWRATGRWPDFCSEPDLPYDCRAEAAKLG